MKTVLLSILAIGILSALTYWVTEIYPFTNEVKKDTAQLQNFKNEQEIQNGDLIFHTSKSNQSKAIQLATKSKYSHMGIIYENDGKYFVYEAVESVKLTPLQEWINRGEKEHYVIKRLKNSENRLTKGVINKMKLYGERFKGKSYDIYFEWSDDKIYCSELVWKIYKNAVDIEIGQLQQLSDFDLSNKIVRNIMKERYGENIPMDEKVISPAEMFNSHKLITIE